MKSTGELTIGQLAEQFGLAAHVLRHWELMGLLAPARDSSGRRRYDRADVYRVAVILGAKRAGLSLDDIRSIMTAPTPNRRKQILLQQRDALGERIAAAQASLTLIDAAWACRHGDIATCPRLRAALAEQARQQPASR